MVHFLHVLVLVRLFEWFSGQVQEETTWMMDFLREKLAVNVFREVPDLVHSCVC